MTRVVLYNVYQYSFLAMDRILCHFHFQNVQDQLVSVFVLNDVDLVIHAQQVNSAAPTDVVTLAEDQLVS